MPKALPGSLLRFYYFCNPSDFCTSRGSRSKFRNSKNTQKRMRFLRSEVKREPPIQTGGGAPHQDPAVAVRLVLRGSSQLAKANAWVGDVLRIEASRVFLYFSDDGKQKPLQKLGFWGFFGSCNPKNIIKTWVFIFFGFWVDFCMCGTWRMAGQNPKS